MTDAIRIPGKGVDAEGDDVLTPVVATLAGLNLLPEQAEREKASQFTSAFSGPPESVALIEAGATALSKWWAAGVGVAATTLWAGVSKWWGDLKVVDLQGIALWVAGIATAAAILAIGYIVASDVRGRSSASVATINARAAVTVAYINASLAANTPDPTPGADQVVALPGQLKARNTLESGPAEDGWMAIALRRHEGVDEYFVVKDAQHVWVPTDKVEILPV